MIPVQTAYPKFEANQVLTNEHLNTLFAYLDEQGRLTRTNLIGIGIVCGLEPTVASGGANIVISKGCGVTSEGHMVVWDDPGPLEFFKPYTVPDDVAYATFMDDSVTPAVQYPLWELTPDRNNDPAALPLSQNFLRGIAQPAGREDEKVLLLFLECKAESNKNCSPNSCDDKGATITTTVRPLLIRKRDMDAIQAKVRALGPSAAEYLDMAASTSLRFNLPELRLRRFNVESTRLTTTGDLFDVYQGILNRPFLDQVADAFSAAYTAFRPVLLRDFPTNPFAALKTDWAFLHNGGIVSQNRYRWYQYFYDHLDTLLQAYLEFRQLGLEVIGLCCPDGRLFPRHLMLANAGVAPPEMAVYRHHFMPSPLFSRLHGAMADLTTLFGRLVELLRSLELPPQVTGNANQDPEMRITPSVLGQFPLSDKAIPYHYRPAPLYQWWDYRKNRQNKAQLNLGYRALSWNTIHDFVLNPLRYDLEPHNFLRVEGHIGQPFTEVMRDLLALKAEYRLPIEIVALKTGRNSDAISLTEDLDSCQFRDLEALYDALREELLCTLCEGMMYFYETDIVETPSTAPRSVPAMPLLRDCAPNYRYAAGTIGSWFETYLASLQTAPYIDVDQNNINANSVLPVYCVLFANRQEIPNDTYPHAVATYYLMKLAAILPDKLNQLGFADFENKYQDLMALVRFFRSEEARSIPTALRDYAPEEELIDYFDHLLFSCKLDPIRAVHAEFERRKRRMRDQLLLTNFIRQHPGIQHKAGVPLGGTFLVVYHGEDQTRSTAARKGRFVLRGRVTAGDEALPGVTITLGNTATGTLTDSRGNFTIISNVMPVMLRVRMVGNRLPIERLVTDEEAFIEIDINRPVVVEGTRFQDIGVGEVIADFYLPYLCCSDCEPVQFVLPKTPPTFSWQRAGCTQPEGRGPVLITPRGGTAPYQYTADGGSSWMDFDPAAPIGVTNNTALQIRDAEGTVSIVQTVTVEPPLLLTLGSARTCNATGTRFTVPVTITGGRAPYKINGVTITGTAGTAEFASGQGGNVVVEDSNTPPCTASAAVAAHTCPQPCTLPCQGITLECGHLFWLPTTANSDLAYERVNIEVVAFSVSGERRNGGEVVNKVFNADELKELGGILSQVPPRFNMGQFHTLWAARVTAANAFIQRILQAAFGPEAGVVMQWNYDSRSLNGFSVLNIERYQCHQFNIDLRVRYTQQQAQFERQMQYATNTATPPAAGTNVVINWTQGTQQRGEGKGVVPAFNCTRRDRCTPGAPPTVLCRQPRPISIPKDGDNIINLTVSPATPRDVVYWEFNLAQPTISQEVTPRDVRFTGNGNEVKVLVVQANGCAAADRGILLRID